MHKVSIVAHRGFSSKYPENTVIAFEKSLGIADWIELDVELSKDGSVIVMHDDTLDRTTNGTGKVYEKTLEELKKLDTGSYFDKKFIGERIPTLEEVLKLKRFKINIELKIRGSFVVDDLIQKSVALVKKYNYEDVIFSSFDHDAVKKVKLLDKSLKANLIIYKDKFQGDIVDYVLKHFADGVHMHKDFITLDLVNKLYVKELNIGVYTVNDMQIMKKFIRWNIDFLFTDYPDKAYVVLGKI